MNIYKIPPDRPWAASVTATINGTGSANDNYMVSSMLTWLRKQRDGNIYVARST